MIRKTLKTALLPLALLTTTACLSVAEAAAPTAAVPAAELQAAELKLANPFSSGLTSGRCPEFQFVATVPFTASTGKPQESAAYLWIPEGAQKLRGVVLAQQNVAEQAFVENPAIRQACRELDLALVWFYPAFAPRFEHPEVDGVVLEKALSELSAVSGYTEIATLPWLPFGHSTMGHFVQRLANWKPERCIAQIVFKSKVDFSHPNNRQIPLFEVGGQYTEWTQQNRRDWSAKEAPFGFWPLAGITKERASSQRPISYLLEYGSSHFNLDDNEAGLIAMYLRKAVAARLPIDTGGGLRPVEIDHGWVVDLNMLNPNRSAAMPVKAAVGEAKNGVWFFDEEMAKAVEKRMNVNWKRQTQVPVLLNPDGTVPVFAEDGLLNWVAPLAADDGVSLKLTPAFLDKIPSNFTLGAGQALGHSSKGPIEIGWLTGSFEITDPQTIRMTIDRRRTIHSSMLWVRHPGDEIYRPSIQPIKTGYINNRKGKPQTITFAKIADQVAGCQQLELQASSDAGLPVDYCVIVGPATVSGKTLRFTAIPPRSHFPVKVTVLAYQYGRSTEPAVQGASLVEQSFMIIKE